MSTSLHKRQAEVRPLSFGIPSLSHDTLPQLPFELAQGGSNAETTITTSNTKKMMLPTMEGVSFEKIKNILYLEASGNYTMLHFTDGRQVLVCRSLCEIEQRLPGSAFVRIHRSHTVHLLHLKKYVKGKGGHVVLDNGATLAVSSGQKEHFLTALEKYFS